MSKVLIVEDDKKTLDITQRFLKAAGFNAVSALGGKRALELLQNENLKPDLVVIDIDMKIITGRDVANECVGRKIPFILISGAVAGEDMIGYISDINYSFSELLHKPIDLYKLNNIIRKRLDLAG
jgi:DNA-binding NtrC family response regulator